MRCTKPRTSYRTAAQRVVAYALTLGAMTLGVLETMTPDIPWRVPGIVHAKPENSAASTETEASATLTTGLLLSWEGRDLLSSNIDALLEFRREHPEARFIHLISPAYFLKPGADAAAAAAQIRLVARSGDSFGLLIGGWKSLVTASGVIFRSAPSFWGHTLNAIDCKVDCGLEVPIHIYPEQDLEKIIRTGLDVLEQQGFGRARAFLAEAWVAAPHVHTAAARLGLRYDFSPVPPELISRRVFHYPLYAWVKGLWPTMTPHSQAFTVNTPAGSLTALPQNLGAIDHLSPKELTAIFSEYVERAKKDTLQQLSIQLGLYQETAMQTMPHFKTTWAAFKKAAAASQVRIESLVLPDTALTLDAPLVH